MENDNSTIYDDVLRTIQERHPELLIPLVNEVFHTSYPVNEKVTRLPEEYQKLVSKVVADSCSVIGNRVYHVECQSTKDGRMMLRMAEYDFMIALANVGKYSGHYRLQMPKSCILYLRGEAGIPEEDELEIELADGQVVTYHVPSVKLEKYTLNEIFEKNLLIFLPYYIMRYEKKFNEIAQDEGKSEKLVQEYENILKQLDRSDRAEREGLFWDMMRLIKRILDYQLRREDALRERMDGVMGGKVLDLPSDKLREEREKGIEQGIEKGIEQGIEQGIEKVIGTLIETYREFGASKEDTQTKLQAKFELAPEQIGKYMGKYWE
ncbi:MAG: hypothetical protein J6K53_14760 [Roseburia sp.]|nr:hypothetical protein [Roseburia sp.]